MERVKLHPWDIIDSKTKWVFSRVPSDVVISSRIRMARNIYEFPFPHNLPEDAAAVIESKIVEAVLDWDCKEMFVLRGRDLSDIEKCLLVERHIISEELLENDNASGVIILPGEKLSIMINEEDHLRIQCIQPGFQLGKAFRQAADIDEFLGKRLNYAFSQTFGHLTACPTNIGTGLRASVILHIPAISMAKKEKGVFSTAEKAGIMLRGFYGEGSEPLGCFYQLSSAETTGKKENEIIEELETMVKLIREEERRATLEMLEKNCDAVRKAVYGSLMQLKVEAKISSETFFVLFSRIALGKKAGILPIHGRTLKNLFMDVMPHHLQMKQGKELSPLERDYERGKIIRKKLRRYKLGV